MNTNYNSSHSNNRETFHQIINQDNTSQKHDAKTSFDEQTLSLLGYPDIQRALALKTSSNLGRKLVETMHPSTSPAVVLKLLQETREAVTILTEGKGLNLGGIHDISPQMEKVTIGVVLKPEELLKIADFMRCIRNLKQSVTRYEFIAPLLFSYALGLETFKSIESDIEYSIEGSIVHSRASHTLEKLRQRLGVLHDKRIEKLNKFLASDRNAKHLQETYFSVRDGRYVIPIKAASRKFVEGSVIGASASGSTVYIEIEDIKDLTIEYIMLEAQEREECYHILKALSERVAEKSGAVIAAMQIIGKYDFILARGRYAVEIKGNDIELTDDETIELKHVRHPLLGADAVPLDISIGERYRSLIITGPNTGGKTLTLKTVGLCVLMVQSGLFPPAAKQSRISLFNKVLVDIGDAQSIEQSLSTFSGHMRSLVDILKRSSRRTLVIIDEIGTGTDPRDGASLGISILEALYDRGAITVASTHYGKIKEYSSCHEGFMNASMDFDRVTLKPLYKLLIGIPGDSNALWISRELGLPEAVLKRAEAINEAHEYVAPRRIESFSKKKSRIDALRTQYEPISEKRVIFQKGDLVYLNESGERRLVYTHDLDTYFLTVFKDGQYERVHEKRVTLDKSCAVLYPEGYDLDQLFIDFKTRKLEKDMHKGRFKDLKELNQRLKDAESNKPKQTNS